MKTTKTINGITYSELRRDSFGSTPHVGVLFNIGADYHSGWIPSALWDSYPADETHDQNVTLARIAGRSARQG